MRGRGRWRRGSASSSSTSCCGWSWGDFNGSTRRTMTDVRKVAVVGAGTMGNGIVHVFAANGYDVTMIDVRSEALEAARKTIAGNLDRQIRKGALAEADRDAALGRIATATDLAAVADADLVI